MLGSESSLSLHWKELMVGANGAPALVLAVCGGLALVVWAIRRRA